MPEFFNTCGVAIFSYENMLNLELLNKTYFTGCKLMKPIHCVGDRPYNSSNIYILRNDSEFDFIEKNKDGWSFNKKGSMGSIITYKTSEEVLNHFN